MNKSVLLDVDFSSLERRVMASQKSQAKALMYQQMQELIKNGISVVTTHDMVVSTPTSDMSDALLRGIQIHSIFGDEYYVAPEPHCQRKAFASIDKFWSARQLGLYGQYIAQLEHKPKTKDVFKGKSTTHHYPWYRRGSKY